MAESSGGVGMGTVVLVSVTASLAVTGLVLWYAMRNPLPLIDTAKTKAVFDTATGQKAA